MAFIARFIGLRISFFEDYTVLPLDFYGRAVVFSFLFIINVGTGRYIFIRIIFLIYG